MAINIGVCEMEAENAKCREYKSKLVKVFLKDISGFEDAAEVDEFVSLDDARSLFPDFAAFLKRNRMKEDCDAIYIEKLKNESDKNALIPKVQKKYTGWILLDELDDARRQKALDSADKYDRLTEWELVGFEEAVEICASCPLSWDKGRGCMGGFGPDNSLLPEIAGRRNCPIVASVPESAKTQRRFSPGDAEALLKEIAILRDALPEEGKIYVRRYAGALERMEAVANVSVKEKCGFYFF